MAVTFVGATSGSTGAATATSLATSFAAGWAADDIAVLFTGYGGGSINVNSGTTGWSAITGFGNPQTQGASSRAYAYWRRLQGGDTAPTIGYDGSITGGWTMVIVRGAPTGSTPIGQAAQSNTSGSSVNIASLTGVLADSMLVTLMHARVPSGTAVPAAWTPDADYTQPAQASHATSRNTGTAQNLRFGGGYRAIASAGNYGGDTWSTDQTASIISLHVEILAAAGGGTVNGTAQAALTFAATAVGTRTVAGTVTTTIPVAATAAGARTVTGTAATAVELTATAAGTRTVLGSAATAVALTVTAAGVRTVLGSAATTVSMTATASGVRTVPGAAATVVTVGATAVGTRTVLGAAVLTVAFTAAAVGSTGDDGIIVRPSSGTTSRPSSGTIVRPDTGIVARP